MHTSRSQASWLWPIGPVWAGSGFGTPLGRSLCAVFYEPDLSTPCPRRCRRACLDLPQSASAISATPAWTGLPPAPTAPTTPLLPSPLCRRRLLRPRLDLSLSPCLPGPAPNLPLRPPGPISAPPPQPPTRQPGPPSPADGRRAGSRQPAAAPCGRGRPPHGPTGCANTRLTRLPARASCLPCPASATLQAPAPHACTTGPPPPSLRGCSTLDEPGGVRCHCVLGCYPIRVCVCMCVSLSLDTRCFSRRLAPLCASVLFSLGFRYHFAYNTIR